MSCGFSLDVEVDAMWRHPRRGVGQLQPGLRAARPQEREGEDDAGGYRCRADEEGEVVAADQRAGERRGGRRAVPWCGWRRRVLRTASPSAPLICWETLVIPEPRPESAAGTSAMAIVSRGMNALPMPRPIAKQAKKIVGKKAVLGPTVLNRSRPITALAMPAVSTRSGPNRLTSRAVMPCERTATVIVQGRNAAPVCRAL